MTTAELAVLNQQLGGLPIDAEGNLIFDEQARSLESELIDENNYGQSDWNYFRATKIKAPTINWGFPTKDKTADTSELTPGQVFLHGDKQVNHNILAIRGIMLAQNYGFMLYDPSEKKVVCSTKAMVERVGDQEYVTNSSMPMPFIVRSPHQSKNKMTTYNNTLATKFSRIQLMGSRSTIEIDGQSVPRTCEACVTNGENICQLPDGKSTNCSLVGEMIMVVFQVGMQVSSGKGSRGINIEWVTPDVLDVEGLKEPFVLRIGSIGTSSATSKIGTGDYDVAVKPKPYYPSKVYTVGEWYRHLQSPSMKHLTSKLANGKVVYKQAMDVYVAEQLSDASKFLPIISATPHDVDTSKWPTLAYQKYFYELARGKGLVNNTLPTPTQNGNHKELSPSFSQDDDLSEAPDVFRTNR